MKLGLLSDSHGRVALVRQALAILDRAGAEAIVHCGDIGSLEVLDELAGRRCWFVWGNTDTPHPSWRPHVEALGLPWPNAGIELTLDHQRIAVFHGHEPAFLPTLDAAQHDYLLHGHTHQRDDYHQGRMHIINPGALHRASVRTVATLDLTTDEVEFLEVNGA
jgi:uncharacterized protein